jgi:hypothetical protein
MVNGLRFTLPKMDVVKKKEDTSLTIGVTVNNPEGTNFGVNIKLFFKFTF